VRPPQLVASSFFGPDSIARLDCPCRANAAQWEARRRSFSNSAPCTGCLLTVVVNAAVTRSGTLP
jgi:hypothetical protein